MKKRGPHVLYDLNDLLFSLHYFCLAHNLLQTMFPKTEQVCDRAQTRFRLLVLASCRRPGRKSGLRQESGLRCCSLSGLYNSMALSTKMSWWDVAGGKLIFCTQDVLSNTSQL